MATKRLVPRGNNEGGIGTSAKTWGDSWLYNLTVTDLDTSTSGSLVVEDSGLLGKRSVLTLLPNLTSLDEGNQLTTTTQSINYVGAGVTTTVGSSNDTTVTIPGTSAVLDTEDPSCFVGLWESATGNLLPKTDESLLYNAQSEILNIIGTLKMGSSANANAYKIHREAIAGAAQGGALDIFGGDTTGGTNHAGGYLNLHAGLGTGTGGGVASGISLYTATLKGSGTTAQTYIKNTLFYTLGASHGIRTFNPADPNDYHELLIGVDGATKHVTVDSTNNNGAHYELDVAGDVIYDSATETHIWKENNNQIGLWNGSGLLINTIATDASLTSFLVESGGLIKKRPLSGIPASLVAVLDTEVTTCFVGLYESATGNLATKTDEGLLYNADDGAHMLTCLGSLTLGTGVSGAEHGVLSTTSVSGAAGNRMVLLAGKSGAGTNLSGGDLGIGSGLGTGTGANQGVYFNASVQKASGTTDHTYLNTAIFSHSGDGGASSTNYMELKGITAGGLKMQVGVQGKTLISTTGSDPDIDISSAGGGYIRAVANTHAVISGGTYAELSSGSADINLKAGGGDIVSTGASAAALSTLNASGLLINNIATDASLTSFLVETGGLIKKRPLTGIPSALTAVTDTDDATCFVGIWPGASGSLAAHTDEVFKFNATDGGQILYTPKTIIGNTNTSANASDLNIYAEPAINGGPTNAVGGYVILRGSSGTGTGAGGGVQCWGTRKTSSGTGGHTVGRIAYFENIVPETSDFTLWDPASVNATDYFRISTAVAGTTKISTLDVAGAAAHLLLDVDGDITFSKTGGRLATVESLRTESFLLAASDESTSLTASLRKVQFRMPYAFVLTNVRASVSVAPTGAALTVDINVNNTSIFENGANNGVRLTIAASATTSVGGTAHAFAAGGGSATPTLAIADDAVITIDVDVIGSTVAGAGLKVTLIGHKSI